MLKEVHSSDEHDRLRTPTVPMPVTLLMASFTLMVGVACVREVGCHAQRYFLRLNDKNHRRRRHKSSLFDITTTDTN
ncbi:hypothetical protein FNV43_RR12985 [Rhamnella rubrinervis]|uniref:Transmembrane protein n=1 Tax=Rhamnella rubrinervis TaxID=2594499 RepID=A0A8K0MEN8_9ROSA|nr:hypothetical protein FNV43_RR12985 [Rhamnella rubrinervis]